MNAADLDQQSTVPDRRLVHGRFLENTNTADCVSSAEVRGHGSTLLETARGKTSRPTSPCMWAEAEAQLGQLEGVGIDQQRSVASSHSWALQSQPASLLSTRGSFFTPVLRNVIPSLRCDWTNRHTWTTGGTNSHEVQGMNASHTCYLGVGIITFYLMI